MELDDFKHAWKEADKNQKPLNQNIMDILQNKSYGPISMLKREFRKHMRFLIVLPIIILATNMADVSAVLNSVMFWSYVMVCIGGYIFFYYNYKLVRNIEAMDGMVKSNLEQTASTLETRLKWHYLGARLVLLFFIVLTEVLPYFQHARMLDKWHSLPVIARFSTYAALLVLQYFLSRFYLQKKFGQHVAYLKQLVKEMQ
jgi:hypothetical protein